MQVPFGLPDEKYVKLTNADRLILDRWIRNKLGNNAVRSQKHNASTNRCEASHLTTLKSVPKSRTYARNFNGRANSACHSMSLGQAKSSLLVNERLWARNTDSGPAYRTRQAMMKREMYHKFRNKSEKHKSLRKRLRVLEHRGRARKSESGYSPGCQDPTVQQDHAYDMT
jgi:hypothetical protein